MEELLTSEENLNTGVPWWRNYDSRAMLSDADVNVTYTRALAYVIQ